MKQSGLGSSKGSFGSCCSPTNKTQDPDDSRYMKRLGRKIYSSKEIKHAKYLRKKFVFVIIPMVNPDGVIAGHYRSSFAGHDLNKMFLFPNKKIHPEIYHLRAMIESTSQRIFSYIDIQGSCKRRCSYLYGPEFPLHDQNYFRVRALPKILDSLADHFRFHS